jgi:5'-nucleotidase
MQLHDAPIDLIVSGINHGANVGLNIYYSGTVAAALEGGFMGIPSVAMSLAMDTTMDFETAANFHMSVLEQSLPLSPGDVLNINMPQLSRGHPHGIRVVPQSIQGFHEYYVPQNDTAEGMAFLLQGGRPHPETPATDTMLLSEGYITVTPLQPDMTNHGRLDTVKNWFKA